MKKFNLLKSAYCVASLLTVMAAFLTFGCTNLIDSKIQGAASNDQNVSESESGTFKINLVNSARYIAAADYELSDVNDWTVTFTEELSSSSTEETKTYEISTSAADSSANSPSVSYADGTLNVKLMPTGIYTVLLSGTSEDFSVSGSKSGVVVSVDSSENSVTMLVGLTKTSEGTGSLSLSLTDSNSALSNYSSSLLVTLQGATSANDTKIYSTNDESKSLTVSYSESVLTVTGSSIASGWYKISFYVNDSLKVYVPSDCVMIEIADGIETTAETTLSVASVKNYYATNKTSSYNGLATVSRANLTSLLNRLAEKLPDEGAVNIYVDELPEIDIDAITSLKAAFKDGTEKTLSIYEENEETAALEISEDADSGSGSITISNALILSASDTSNTLSAGNITSNSNSGVTITLKNGAAISTECRIPLLNFYAVDSTGAKDNWSAYITQPFLTAVSDYSDYISLYEYGKTESSSNYALNIVDSSTSDESSSGYVYYVKPASSAVISAESFGNSASISAALSGVADSSYSSDSTIPYDDDTLTFTISIDESFGTPQSYAWYLNGNSLAVSTSTEVSSEAESSSTSFNPRNTELDVDGTNTVSCYALIDEVMYLAEMNFTFKTAQRSAAVWFDNINISDSYTYSFMQTADDTDNSVSGSALISSLSSSPLYCFDSDFNLWTIESVSDDYNLKKYEIVNSTGLYSTTPAQNVTLTDGTNNITSKPSDITYDVENNLIYILQYGDENSSIYVYSTEDVPAYKTSISFSRSITIGSYTVSIIPSQIAVNGGTAYIAASATVDNTTINCNIYKITFATDGTTTTVIPETFVDSTTLTANLTDYDSSLSSNNSYSSMKITDLQLGDGAGNYTDNIYVLVREYTNSLSNTSASVQDSEGNYTIFSRGALLSINTESGNSITVNGWTTSTQTYTDMTDFPFKFYAPQSSSAGVEFYGPTHFAAVVPKKIVILDDGVAIGSYAADDYNPYFSVSNKDSLVEFDIAESSGLTRGATVSATKPNLGTGFSLTD